MSGAAVYIATTEGPSRVLRLIEAPHQRHSAACLQFKSRKLPISAAYHEFVSFDGGVIARHSGSEQYRLDVSANIDDGESWQLGVFIAHALAHRRTLAGATAEAPDDLSGVDSVIWATGALDADLSVKGVGHIERKLALSEPLFQHVSEQGASLLAMLPAASKTKALCDRLDALKTRFSGFDYRFESKAVFDPSRWHAQKDEPAELPVLTPEAPPGPGSGPKKQAIAIGAAAGVLALGVIWGAFAYNNRLDAKSSPAGGGRERLEYIAPEMSFTAMVSPSERCLSETEPHAQAPQAISWGGEAAAAIDGKLCYIVVDMRNDNGQSDFAVTLRKEDTGEILYEGMLEAGARTRATLAAYLTGGASAYAVSYESDVQDGVSGVGVISLKPGEQRPAPTE